MTSGIAKQPTVTPTIDSKVFGRETVLSFCFHTGLILIAITLSWEFFFESPATITQERLWLILFGTGLVLTGCSWIAGSALPQWQKSLFICGIIAATLYGVLDFASQFDRDLDVLKPGRILRGRFVHEGLGLSFVAAPHLRPIQEVVVTNLATRETRTSDRSRLRFGEEATLLMSSPIQLHVTPFYFSRMDSVVIHALKSQTAFASQPGERLVSPLYYHRVGSLDVLEFELAHDSKQILSRYVFVRSGSFLLTFVLRSPDVKDREFFDKFVKSISITGRKTHFHI